MITAVAGTITWASSTVAANRSDVKYSARGAQDPQEYVVSAVYPLNLMVSTGQTLVRVVPAKVGDPCLLLKVGGSTKLIVLTEQLNVNPCQT